MAGVLLFAYVFEDWEPHLLWGVFYGFVLSFELFVDCLFCLLDSVVISGFLSVCLDCGCDICLINLLLGFVRLRLRIMLNLLVLGQMLLWFACS